MEKKRPLTTIEQRSIEGQSTDELKEQLLDETSKEGIDGAIIDILQKLKQPDLYSIETDDQNTFLKVINKVDGKPVYFTEEGEEIAFIKKHLS